MEYKSQKLLTKIVDESPSLIFVADLETFDLYYVNATALAFAGNPPESEWKKQKCYEFMRGKTEPCDFCNNTKLKEGEVICWTTYSEIQKKYYAVRDKLLTLDNGKQVKLEIANDITDTYSMLAQEKALNSCIETLHSIDTPNQSINKLLKTLATYYHADRGYIFKFSQDKEFMSNTYEWCSEGISSEMEHSQDVPTDWFTEWWDIFASKGEYSIPCLEDNIDKNSPIYHFLELQAVSSLILAPLRDKNSTIVGFIGVDNPEENMHLTGLIRSVTFFIADFLDKTEFFNEQFEQFSYTDTLTGVKNRHVYTKMIEGYEKFHPANIGIIYIDVNGLKTINDTQGYKHGDNLLLALVEILKEYFDNNVYRLGGDEFVVLLENIRKEIFDEEVEKLQGRLESDPILSVSIGATWTDNCENIINQIDHANGIMYLNKQKYYTESGSNPKYQGMLLNTLLSEIEDNRFIVHLQPQVDLKSLEVVSAEALVRKIDEHGKLIPPLFFIPLYEQLEIISHVDLFVFKYVCKMLKEWRDKGYNDSMQIGVNFSRNSLRTPDIVETLCSICEENEISPNRIIIEITESLDHVNKQQQLDIIQNFSNKGFSVSLDDFGSGYSNLSILADADFDEVKLDKSLVDTIIDSSKTRSLVKSILTVCADLEVPNSLAEGIETLDQYDIIKSLHCQKGQGYLFSKPLPVEEFENKYIIPQKNA